MTVVGELWGGPSVDDFDVVVVGSGPAGCSAAIMLGRNGLQVALLEAHRDANHYKRLCTHSIRSSALPTHPPARSGQRLRRDRRRAPAREGMDEVRLDSRTGQGDKSMGTTFDGMILDPLLRATAAATPGVELMLGARVRELTRSGGRINGVVADVEGTQRRIGGHAGGRRRRLFIENRRPGRTSREPPRPNSRFAYQATYRNVKAPTAGQVGSGTGSLT